ncbi:hypothetical protein D3C71_393410 [compost metagenome]
MEFAFSDEQEILAFSSANGWSADDVQATVVAEGDGFVLDATLKHVLDGHGADLLVIAARQPGSTGEAGISLFAVSAERAGIERQMLPTMDQTRRQARIQLKGLYLEADALLGEFGNGWPHLERACNWPASAWLPSKLAARSRCST